MIRRRGLAAWAAWWGAQPWMAARAAVSPATFHVNCGDDLQAALARAGDGDVVELEGGEHRGQSGVIAQRRLTVRAAPGRRAVLHADGRSAEGKAILVVRGGDIAIENLEFRGCRVASGNGAGIRFEHGRLRVADCAFLDNEMGLLSANVPDAELTVERCDFGAAPRHEGSLHHLLYVGTMRRLTLEGSRFGNGWRGHLVKSRAAENIVRYNRLVDGDDGEASYELDLPNGGVAFVVGNLFGQSRRPQNPALLAFGAEGPAHADSALYAAHNTLINDAADPAWFVRHWPERLPPGSEVKLVNNLMIGAAIEGSYGRGEDGNLWLPQPHDANGNDAEPGDGRITAGSARGQSLQPAYEPAVPFGLRPLAPRGAWRAGAFQR